MGPDICFDSTWTAPRELTGNLPRRTRLWGKGIITAFTIAVSLMVGVGFTAVQVVENVRQMIHTAELRTHGIDAVAEVKGLWFSSRSTGVAYAFSVNGEVFTGESKGPKQLLQNLSKSGPIAIRFLPSSPAVNHPASWEESVLEAWIVLVIPAAFGAMGGILLRDLPRQRQIGSEGYPAPGVVTGWSPGSKGGWRVAYRFRTQDGTVAAGKSWSDSPLDVGATICVLYLLQNPQRNAPYPLSYFRVLS